MIDFYVITVFKENSFLDLLSKLHLKHDLKVGTENTIIFTKNGLIQHGISEQGTKALKPFIDHIKNSKENKEGVGLHQNPKTAKFPNQGPGSSKSDQGPNIFSNGNDGQPNGINTPSDTDGDRL